MKRVTATAPSVITIYEPVHITQILGQGLIAIILLLAVAADAWSADGAGTVKTLAGSGTVIRESSVLPVATGQRVFPGDRIVSARDSYVGIMLNDDTRLTLGPGSELLIREFEFNPSSYAGDLAVSFLKGTARVVTGLIGKNAPEKARFSTPTATIGIRGTEFVVDIEVK
jgi:hypothetical protein